jgi:hypothetical protein
VVLGALALVGKVQTTHRDDAQAKKARFALELKACQEALAKGKPSKCQLYGKIQFVTSFPDVKVQVVTSFPDIKVQRVQSFPDSPGKWQEVTSFPDYKVQIVNSFPDYKIQYVNSFPGCN